MSDQTTLPRLEIRGGERFSIWTPETSFLVTHTMMLQDSSPSPSAINPFLSHLSLALTHTFNRHPRMRARLVVGEFAVAEIHPKLSQDDIADQRLLHVKEVTSEDIDVQWQSFVEARAEKPFDRFKQFAFELHVWVDHASRRIRLLLFSDHYVSDGRSGMTILNDIISIAAGLSRGEDVSRLAAELPLRGSVYEQNFRSHTWMLPIWTKAVEFGGKMLFKMTPKFTPLIQPREGHAAFSCPPPNNKTSTLFATGSRENLAKLLTRCREEKTTFLGALSASIIVAFVSIKNIPEHEKMRLAMGLTYDMRGRVTEPVEEETVGFYAHAGDFEKLVPSDGLVPKDTSFWMVARAAKREVNENQNSFTLTKLLSLLVDQYYHSGTKAEFFDDLPRNEYASSGDAGMSSLGPYKHKTTHTMGESELTIQSLHFSCRCPFLAPLSQFYVTSIPNGVGISLNHCLDEDVGKLLLDAVVQVMENVWRVEANDTIAKVCHSVLGKKTDPH